MPDTQDMRIPPIGGPAVPFKGWGYSSTLPFYQLTERSLCNLYMGERLIVLAGSFTSDRAPYRGDHAGAREHSYQETAEAWALVRSKLWRCLHEKWQVKIGFVTQKEYDEISADESQYKHLRELSLHTFESQIEEARLLGFDAKCLKTLENVLTITRDTGKAYRPVYMGFDDQNRPLFRRKADSVEDGVAFGCTEDEAPLVYEYLFEERLVRLHYALPNIGDGLELTPAGYAAVDKIRRGKQQATRKAFFIRRWDPAMDSFFADVRARVQESTGVTVAAVWDTQHVDKIDDRILRLIRESPVVVLDVDAARFNVGLEAGYALALGKPIVAIRQKPDPWLPLPFDIATLNTFDYDVANPEQLAEIVSARILEGLRKASTVTG